MPNRWDIVQTTIRQNAWVQASIVNAAGTSITLSSAVPAAAIDILVLIQAMATNGNNQPPIVRLGDEDGVVTSGYVGVVRGAAAAKAAVTDGLHTILAADYAAAETVSGIMRISRWDASGHLWIASGCMNEGTNMAVFSGSLALSKALETVTITTPGGSATLSAGSARIRYR